MLIGRGTTDRVAFSPDQTLIAVASKDHTVRVYGLR